MQSDGIYQSIYRCMARLYLGLGLDTLISANSAKNAEITDDLFKISEEFIEFLAKN
jgi:hypothetical protein